VSEHTAVTASCHDSVSTPQLEFNLCKMKVMTELDQEDRKKRHTDTGLIQANLNITLLMRTEERLV